MKYGRKIFRFIFLINTIGEGESKGEKRVRREERSSREGGKELRERRRQKGKEKRKGQAEVKEKGRRK